MLKIKDVQFVKSISRLQDKPHPYYPEFAFAGRSNVGKSSLINCLLNRKNLARVSKQPGKTRSINYFLINRQFYLVDLPGYGFARVSAGEKKRWQEMIESYLLQSEELVQLFVLVDAVVKAQKNDLQLVEWLNHHQIPFAVVATKADKLSQFRLNVHLNEITRQLQLDDSHPIFPFSAVKRTGRGELLGYIDRLLKGSV